MAYIWQQTWSASLLLVEWMHRVGRPNWLPQQDLQGTPLVVEVGAGTGLSALAAAELWFPDPVAACSRGIAAAVVATDAANDALLAIQRSAGDRHLGHRLQTRLLNWWRPADWPMEWRNGVRCVLAADLFYLDRAVRPVTDLLAHLVHDRLGVVWLVCPGRPFFTDWLQSTVDVAPEQWHCRWRRYEQVPVSRWDRSAVSSDPRSGGPDGIEIGGTFEVMGRLPVCHVALLARAGVDEVVTDWMNACLHQLDDWLAEKQAQLGAMDRIPVLYSMQ